MRLKPNPFKVENRLKLEKMEPDPEWEAKKAQNEANCKALDEKHAEICLFLLDEYEAGRKLPYGLFISKKFRLCYVNQHDVLCYLDMSYDDDWHNVLCSWYISSGTFAYQRERYGLEYGSYTTDQSWVLEMSVLDHLKRIVTSLDKYELSDWEKEFRTRRKK